MKNQLVTVFGGSGFLGRHVVRRLAKAGYRIRVAVRRPHLAHFLRPMGSVGQIQILAVNLRNESEIARALEGATACVNLVGVLSPWGKQSFKALHADAPGHIARHAKIQRVQRIIHLSAIGADKRSPSRYARTKAEGENALKKDFPEVTILRPSIIFGVEDQFFNRFANLARYLPALPLFRGGKTRFQPVFVEDVAQAVLACLEQPQTRGRIYELGGPSTYSFKDLFKLIFAETGRKRALIPIPGPLAWLQASILGLLPGAPLTLDQLRQLKRDNVVKSGRDAGEVGTFADLGIAPVALEVVLPSYLWRFRKTGQFEVLEGA